MSHSIHHDLSIQAPIDKIYAAVSEPEYLINWWPLKCTGKPEQYGTYNFYFSPDYDWHGKVIEANKNKAFHIRMTDSDEDWEHTSFGFDLEPKDGAVQLKFWHVGWPACNDHFRRSSFCWAMLLNGLKNYVEKGEIIPFKDRE